MPLTTTRSSMRATRSRIAKQLISRLLNLETLPDQELWKAELIVHGSTGPAPR